MRRLWRLLGGAVLLMAVPLLSGCNLNMNVDMTTPSPKINAQLAVERAVVAKYQELTGNTLPTGFCDLGTGGPVAGISTADTIGCQLHVDNGQMLYTEYQLMEKQNGEGAVFRLRWDYQLAQALVQVRDRLDATKGMRDQVANAGLDTNMNTSITFNFALPVTNVEGLQAAVSGNQATFNFYELTDLLRNKEGLLTVSLGHVEDYDLDRVYAGDGSSNLDKIEQTFSFLGWIGIVGGIIVGVIAFFLIIKFVSVIIIRL